MRSVVVTLAGVLMGSTAFGQGLPEGMKIQPIPSPKAGMIAVLHKEGSDRVPVTFVGASVSGRASFTDDPQPPYTVVRVGDLGPQDNTSYIVPANARPAQRFVRNDYLWRLVLSDALREKVQEAAKEAKTKAGRLPKKRQKAEEAKRVGAALTRLGIPVRLHPAVLDAP
ncbi:MAG: hypothetical protein WBX00_08255 [Isosphaeraceae bacterium]